MDAPVMSAQYCIFVLIFSVNYALILALTLARYAEGSLHMS